MNICPKNICFFFDRKIRFSFFFFLFRFPSLYSWICSLCTCGYVPFLAFALSFLPVGSHRHHTSLQFVSHFMPVFSSQKRDTEQNYTVLPKSWLLNTMIALLPVVLLLSLSMKEKSRMPFYSHIVDYVHVSELCKFLSYWGILSLECPYIY